MAKNISRRLALGWRIRGTVPAEDSRRHVPAEDSRRHVPLRIRAGPGRKLSQTEGLLPAFKLGWLTAGLSPGLALG